MKIGKIQPKLIEILALDSKIITEKNWKVSCKWALKKIQNQKPCALIVKRDFVD
jgi:hypothetical protein